MSVRLAAQVLSETVGKALQQFGDEEASETAKFILLVDKFFDCLNVRSITGGRKKLKEFTLPYRESDDFRMQWLKEFLSYLDKWEESVNRREGYNATQKAMMTLSRETLEGIRITVMSFLEIIPKLLSCEGVKFVLSERLNQDPLEKYFGKQRQCGATNENPNVKEFIRIMESIALDPFRGNCTSNDKTIIVSDEPLPKRRKRKT